MRYLATTNGVVDVVQLVWTGRTFVARSDRLGRFVRRDSVRLIRQIAAGDKWQRYDFLKIDPCHAEEMVRLELVDDKPKVSRADAIAASMYRLALDQLSSAGC